MSFVVLSILPQKDLTFNLPPISTLTFRHIVRFHIPPSRGEDEVGSVCAHQRLQIYGHLGRTTPPPTRLALRLVLFDAKFSRLSQFMFLWDRDLPEIVLVARSIAMKVMKSSINLMLVWCKRVFNHCRRKRKLETGYRRLIGDCIINVEAIKAKALHLGTFNANIFNCDAWHCVEAQSWVVFKTWRTINVAMIITIM